MPPLLPLFVTGVTGIYRLVYFLTSKSANEKSVAVGLTLQDASDTLTDAEITAFVDSALAALTRECGARLR